MMSFSEFYGNADVVGRLREMLARDRLPHAVILAGPQGAGKYTLALMLARAMNCLGIAESGDQTIGRSETPFATGDLPDFCGKCENCRRIGEAQDLEARCAEAVEAREGLRDTDKRETRILVQTHPDVLVIPPDPDAFAPGYESHACRCHAGDRKSTRPDSSHADTSYAVFCVCSI